MKLDNSEIDAIKNMCLFEFPGDPEYHIKKYFKITRNIDVDVDIDLSEDIHTILIYEPTDKLYIPEDLRILELEFKLDRDNGDNNEIG